jgi:hypothetical protein
MAMRNRYDFGRSTITLAASALAVFGLAISGRDMGIVVWAPVQGTLAVEAAIAALLAVAGGPQRWSLLRRMAGGVAGAILLLLTPLLLYLGTAYPGCACSGAPPIPLIAGIADYTLVVAACYGVPGLIVVAALIPSRAARGDPRPAPGASSASSSAPPASND